MRTIVCGSRGASVGVVFQALALCGWVPTVVLSGAAKGADTHGEVWARFKNVPLEQYPADWDGLGKRAGLVRNGEMVAIAEAMVAIWDGVSPGTKDAIAQATRAGLKVYVHKYG